MKTITIPAAINGVDGVYPENFGEPGVAVITATASFFIQPGNQQKFKISTGQRIGAATGPALGKITFLNPSATAIDVVLGDFNAVVAAVPPDLVNVQGITINTNPFVHAYYDPSGVLTDPFAYSLPLQPNLPFRRLWCYFDAATFTYTFSQVFLAFYQGTTLMLTLPVWYKMDVSPIQYGICMNPIADGKNTDGTNDSRSSHVSGANEFFYSNSDGSKTIYRLKPFDVRIVADSCKFVKDTPGTGVVSGNMRAFLGVLSAEEKF